MENKKIIEMLGNPEKYVGEPIWIDMIFAVRRLMEDSDIFNKIREAWKNFGGEDNGFEQAIQDCKDHEKCKNCKYLVTDTYGNYFCEACQKECRYIKSCPEGFGF